MYVQPLLDNQENQNLTDVRNYGAQSLAYASLQQGIEEFRHPAFRGFIPYFSLWGIAYVLSDPIVPLEDLRKALALFIHQKKRVVFCQISEHCAKILTYFGFKINAFGVEHILDLNHFDVTWKQRRRLKAYLSSLTNQGFKVSEQLLSTRDLAKINQEWLKSKSNGRELKFMARPFVSIFESDVRYFFILKDEKLLGFCSFDPMYQDQEIIGYGLQHLRVSDSAPSGAQDFLILKALVKFKEEGLKRASLGLSPLYQRSNEVFAHSFFVEAVFSLLYQTSFFYNYRYVGEHKEQYKAKKLQTYLAVNKGFVLKDLIGLLRVNRLI